MGMVSREEKLILQMRNIEAILSNPAAPAEQKVFLVTLQMSYLNELVNSMIQPFRDEVGNSELLKLANETFVHFIEPVNKE